MRRLFTTIAMVLCLPIVACNAQESGAPSEFNYVDGKDFQSIPRPVRTANPDKIEVTEVFWYGCIHCFNFEPALEEWVAAQPDDVDFQRVPAMWHPVMELHAKMYYAGEALGITDDVHYEIFKELNDRKAQINDEAAAISLMEDNDVDPEQYRRALSSFGVSNQVVQAKSKAASYGIRGTPEMIVDGKYRVSTTMTGSQANMLRVVEALVERERQARAAAN